MQRCKNSGKAYSIARQRTGEKQEHQKEFHDNRVHGRFYQVGDKVWLHSPVIPRGHPKKLLHPWTGPWQIIKRLSDAVYRIQGTSGHWKRLVVHFDRLKPSRYSMGKRHPGATNTQNPSESRKTENRTPQVYTEDDSDKRE